MFGFLPTLTQLIISLAPGVPDDIAAVEAEVKELLSNDTTRQKVIAGVGFLKKIVTVAETALGITL